MTISNNYTVEEIDKIGAETGHLLAESSLNTDKSNAAKEASNKARLAAYDKAHVVMEAIGLDRDAKSAREFTKNPMYIRLYNAQGQAISKKLGDTIGNHKPNGQATFTARVNKQISRLNTAFRENNSTSTQSKADVEAKERAKEKIKINEQMAVVLQNIIAVHTQNDEEAVQILLDRACNQFPQN